MAMLIRQLSKADRGCRSIAPFLLHRIGCDVRGLAPLPSQVPRWLIAVVRSIQEIRSTGALLVIPPVGRHTNRFIEQGTFALVSIMVTAPKSPNDASYS